MPSATNSTCALLSWAETAAFMVAGSESVRTILLRFPNHLAPGAFGEVRIKSEYPGLGSI